MAILDPDDADHHLAWPETLLRNELDRRVRIARTARGKQRGHHWTEAVGRLLRSAFDGPGLAEEFEAQSGDPHDYRKPITEAEVDWIMQLTLELTDASRAPAPRPYWSARYGAKASLLTLQEVADRFVSLVQRLSDRQGLWAEPFGTDCPDGIGDPVDPPRRQITDLLGRDLPLAIDWPLDKGRVLEWTRDDLFDLMEVLHDLASWPGTWAGHDYGGCVGHPGDFSKACGRGLYRYEVNDLLSRSDVGVRLAEAGEDQGRIVQHDNEELAAAVDDALAAGPESQTDEIEHAVALFRQRDRDVVTMRSAIVALAGVIEAHRSLLKQELLKGDEGALFDIANNFDLRHRRADQRADYDPVFLEWIFHWYLATTALIGRLRSRTESPTPSPSPPDEDPF